MEQTIKEMLERQIPDIKASYIRSMESMLDNITKHYQLGVPGSFRGINNTYFYHIWANIRPLMETEVVKNQISYIGLNQEKLEKAAEEYAKQAALEWYGKIVNKVGELTMPVFRNNNSGSFVIVGNRDGHLVEINQQIIVNCSSKGVLFNQFPALLYVDNKKVSAASYKKLFN